MPGGRGDDQPALAAPVHPRQQPDAVAQSGGGIQQVPATAAAARHRPGVVQGVALQDGAKRLHTLAAVQVQGIEPPPGGKRQVGVGPAPPPAPHRRRLGRGEARPGGQPRVLARLGAARPGRARTAPARVGGVHGHHRVAAGGVHLGRTGAAQPAQGGQQVIGAEQGRLVDPAPGGGHAAASERPAAGAGRARAVVAQPPQQAAWAEIPASVNAGHGGSATSTGRQHSRQPVTPRRVAAASVTGGRPPGRPGPARRWR
jgi:hypothetical protein